MKMSYEMQLDGLAPDFEKVGPSMAYARGDFKFSVFPNGSGSRVFHRDPEISKFNQAKLRFELHGTLPEAPTVDRCVADFHAYATGMNRGYRAGGSGIQLGNQVQVSFNAGVHWDFDMLYKVDVAPQEVAEAVIDIKNGVHNILSSYLQVPAR
jgi:hypothetical protein